MQGAAITLAHKLQMQLATTHANLSAAKAVELVHAAASLLLQGKRGRR